jgi:Tol biopolymer transport system component
MIKERETMNNKLLRITLLVTAMGMLLASCAAPAQPRSTSSGQPAASMVGSRLLYSRFTEATHTFTGMYVSLADGSAETSVPLPGPEGGGRWSWDGKQIAVMTVLADGRIGTAIIAPDGTILRVFVIPDASLNLVCTVWSRDDTRLACQGWDDANPSHNGIYTVRSSDGKDLQRLTTTPAGMNDDPGDFSPDGQLVFMRAVGPEGPDPLMLVDANGGELRPLSNDPMEDTGRFSPDGLSVLTAANGRILVLNLDGKVLHEISIDAKYYLFGPAWSPDGSRIAFSMDMVRGPFADIFTSLPDGTDLQQVTNTPENEITVDWGVGGG